MLGKLIKHEFHAVSRLLLPLHLALIAITFVGRFYVQFAMDHMDYRFSLIHVSLFMFYFLALFAIFVLTYVYLYILRPHRNWFSDEGYLIHTLPVTPAAHIWSKLIVAMCWVLLDSFLLILSVFLMVVNPQVLNSWPEFIEMLQEMVTATTGMDYVLGSVAYILNLLITFARGLLICYMCLAIGHSFNQYKLLISIGIYIGVSMGMSLITTLAGILFSMPFGGYGSLSLFMISSDYNTLSQQMTWFDTVLSLVVAAAAFFVTQYFLSKRLNLE
ncbi:MAG: hypothetical protein HFI31_05655 [Lachnospiraceae bacterium]|nr:hypothetical protein [Lachnospiraceae bacterium]